ncbi:MAG TPA: hypothetical protein VL379_18000 [Pseudomonadales bacterium]|jgi:hypothetical protein|nr:hypothetical protein [Pseudomonadales bacterium]
MARSKKTPRSKKPTDIHKNQGEGDRESARRFNEAERAFVESERGRSAIRSSGNTPGEEEDDDLREAEADAASRARENDPEEKRDHRKPAR